jgi:hypothetical protein
MNLESTSPRGRPRNRWQDEVREAERIVGGEEWQKKCMIERNGRCFLEQQAIITFCT